MKLNKLERCIVLKRYKRFFMDVKHNNQIKTIYLPNTGPMKGVWSEGDIGYFSKIEKPKKMTHKMELIKSKKSLIGINTHNPNRIVEEAIEKDQLNFLKVNNYKREVKVTKDSNSKFDFLVNEDTIIEVKNVSSAFNGQAVFPDTVSERALRHLNELIHLRNDYRVILIFCIQRNDVNSFRPGYEFDKKYAKVLKNAIEKKLVEVFAFDCNISLSEITLGKEIPIKL
jgi:sugar fermentation stimulation protein A